MTLSLTNTPRWHHAPCHFFQPDTFYMITGSTLHKEHIFKSPADLTLLCDRLLLIPDLFNWQIQAWAVFPNHYHFIAKAPEETNNLESMLNRLHSQTAREINKQHRARGRQVWYQFWDTCLTYETSYLARLNYVHNNAIKHGLVTVAEDYPYCSAAWFAEHSDALFAKRVNAQPYDGINVEDDF